MKIGSFIRVNIFAYTLMFIVFLCPHNLIAYNGPGSPFIHNFYPLDYKGHAQNWDIVQDSRGITYFANTNGFVLSYDGIHWRQSGVTPNNSTVRSLDVDKNDIVYVGAVGEIGYLEPDSKGKMQYKSLIDKLNVKDRTFYDVWHVFATDHGVYFITMNKIFRYYKGKISIMKTPKGILRGISKINNSIFLVSSKGLHIITNGKIYLMPHTSFIEVRKNYVQIFPYPDNSIIIFIQKQGTYTYKLSELFNNNGSIKSKFTGISKTVINKFTTEIDEYIKKKQNYCGANLPDYNYALGTASGSIVIVNRYGKIVRYIGKNQGLPNRWIFSIYPDKSGNLWVALNGFISYIETGSPLSVFNENNDLESYIITVAKYKDKLYVGDFKGINYLSLDSTSQIKEKPIFTPLLREGSCWAFMKTHGILLAGGRFGLASINHKGIIHKIKTSGIVSCLGSSKIFPNHIFLGLTTPSGIEVIKFLPSNKISKVNLPKLNEIKHSINTIISDNSGNLWLGTDNNGIIFIRFIGNQINKFDIFYFNTKNGLPHNKINFIALHNNHLVLSTVSQLYISSLPVEPYFIPKKLNFISESTYGKWFNDNNINVNQIIFKTKESMLINTGGRIFRLIRQDDKSYKRVLLPLQKTKSTTFMGLLFEENKIAWIGSNVNLFKYDMQKKKNYKSDYYTLIRRVTVNNKKEIFNGTNYLTIKDNISDKPIKRPIVAQPKTLKITLNHSENNITFEYAAPFFEFSQDTRYSYFLEGMEKNWSEWTEKTLKEYTNLYGGKYRFKVKAKNIFGHESKIAIYEFTVQNPWYLTVYAYLTYFIILIIFMFIGIQLNSRRLLKAKKKLEKIIKKRTAEIVKQKDEILMQKYELQKQAEKLSETNIELELINKELEKLSIVVSETDNAVLIMDTEGNIEWVNEGFTRMYEDTLEQFVNESGGNILDLSSNENINDYLEKCITTLESVRYESMNTTRLGKKIWAYTSLTPILGNDGKVDKIIAIDSDITKIKEAEEKLKEAYAQLEEIARIDALTEIPNRRIFEETVLSEWRRCYRYKLPLSLIMIDIDNFKKYNDTYGHQRGDVCLKTVGVILKYSLNRVGDLAARYGGEEFSVILSDTNKDGALKIAEEIRTRIESLKIPHKFSNNKIVTVSLGVATMIPNDPDNYGKIIKIADSALYKSKEQGKNRVTYLNK